MRMRMTVNILAVCVLALCRMVLCSLANGQSTSDEVLYNGILLTSPWPPFRDTLPLNPPPDPPYLVSPPAVIPIDVGRQLLVDDFLIDESNLKRTWHTADFYPDNPVLKPDRPWEQQSFRDNRFASAMPFSDGVWYDPQDKLFKIWYMGGFCLGTCYATSKDGIHWDKPSLDVEPGTNVVHPGDLDCATVWLDLAEQDPKRRYKMIRFPTPRHPQLSWVFSLHFSADGIHWSPPAVVRPVLTRTTFFHNPFRKVWVFSIRHGIRGMESLYKAGAWRSRMYWENPDFVSAALWSPGQPGLWAGADRLDSTRGGYEVPQLYNVDAVAYESLMLGHFTVLRGTIEDSNRPKINAIVLGFSRDGWHWTRPDRRAFIPVSERGGDWNWGNVQSAGGCCLVVGDKLYFYVSGRTDTPGSFDDRAHKCTTGLATLRRDGFVSMGAGDKVGRLTTRPVRFKGKHVFVNVDADEGELRAELLDKDGDVIAPFTRENCAPISADKTLQAVNWKGAKDLSALAGEVVRFRFYLTNGELYAFWVSPDASGASHGYVAAGGPGFTGPTDTVGSLATESR